MRLQNYIDHFFRDRKKHANNDEKSYATVAVGQSIGVNLRHGPPTFSKAGNRSRWGRVVKDENTNIVTSPPPTIRKVTEKLKNSNSNSPSKSVKLKPVLRRVIDEVVIDSSSSDDLEVTGVYQKDNNKPSKSSRGPSPSSDTSRKRKISTSKSRKTSSRSKRVNSSGSYGMRSDYYDEKRKKSDSKSDSKRESSRRKKEPDSNWKNDKYYELYKAKELKEKESRPLIAEILKSKEKKVDQKKSARPQSKTRKKSFDSDRSRRKVEPGRTKTNSKSGSKDRTGSKAKSSRRRRSRSSSSSSSSSSSTSSSDDSSTGSSDNSSSGSTSSGSAVATKKRAYCAGGDVDLRKVVDLDLRAKTKHVEQKIVPVVIRPDKKIKRTKPTNSVSHSSSKSSSPKVTTPQDAPLPEPVPSSMDSTVETATTPPANSKTISDPSDTKRLSEPEEGELLTEEDDTSRKISQETIPSLAQTDASADDDDIDLATLVHERFPAPVASDSSHIDHDGDDEDELDSDKDSESEDALANSPIDPIANFAFETDIRTPSDAPGTPQSSLEHAVEQAVDDHLTLELDEVNWELFKSGRKIAYFRPLIGKSHFFHPRPISDNEEFTERSPFFLRTPESDTDGDIHSAAILAEKIFNHLVDELLLEISFEITEAFLEEKIEHSKEALKDRFVVAKTDSLITEIVKSIIHDVTDDEVKLECNLLLIVDQLVCDEAETIARAVSNDEQLSVKKFYDILDLIIFEIIKEDLGPVMVAEQSQLLTEKQASFKKSLTEHSTCCLAQPQTSRRASCESIRADIKRYELQFVGTWVFALPEFRILSLDAKIKILDHNLLSCDSISQLTHDTMIGIEFEQEDYEVIYKWPHVAKKEIFQKNKKIKAEKSKRKKESAKVIPPVVKTVIPKLPLPPPVIHTPLYTREPSYYDEDVEECFTHRDSNNQIVDDYINLVSSSDEEPKGNHISV